MAAAAQGVTGMAGGTPPGRKGLLILDLDETLIHARETPLDRPADFEIFGYHVYRRPHLDAFLAACADWYDLAIWSSASDRYVVEMVRRIFPDPSHLHFIWGRSRATLGRLPMADDLHFHYPDDHRHYLKPLTKVRKRGWPLERILIVDDTPEKCARNYGNAIYPRPFEGDPEDGELLLLQAYLHAMKDCANVRRVEKRRWRDAARGMIEGRAG
ncbi:NIF family HAD-type phosphatase [Sphingomonas sp.]|uniref:NIF family HAD-type phosphatase n=1 Tax=Sphingomonas sp. TaxID=28214 RepID=UPI0025D84D6A|nr:HAD family hydrolase [Sphingomonas sp.]